ncbi:MAG: POTRA domain-containing protein [Putridiphycobacter sp.]|nr:POTRA domain-containing protein [Putridiphycobacter sp.]
MRRGLLFLIIFLFSFSLSAQTIDTIKFEGLTKTSETYLRSLLLCKEGLLFNDSLLKEDEQTLHNLNLFFSVNSSSNYHQQTNTYRIIFNIIESTYIFPVIDISGFRDVLRIQLGVNNINFKGEQKTVGVWYQYYDRHSFSAYYRVPKYLELPFGHDIVISKYSTVEPLYFENKTARFNFDNYSIWLNGIYWINKYWNVQTGFTPIYEIYEQLDSADLNLPAKQFTFWKYRVNSSINFTKQNYRYERLTGVTTGVYLESIQTHDMPEASFFMTKLTTRYHYLIGRSGNLAWRHQLGFSTNNFSPFSPFVLDGFINLRGVGNRVMRGTGIHFINLEYRHTFIKNNWLTMQGVSFIDAGAIREAGQSWQRLFDINDTKTYAGLGIRLHSNKVYKTILRIDYGIRVNTDFNGGLSFGIGQFF